MRTTALVLAVVAAAQVPAASADGSPEKPGVGSGATSPPASDPPLPAVVGGNPAPAGRWNDAAAVYVRNLPICTGTLIGPDLVLTAGHCIGEGLTAVKLGEVDLSADGGEIISIERQVAHPGPYDVGLLVLERASSFTPRVLATGCVLERYLENGAPVAIVGWGAVDQQGRQVTDVLMEAMSVVTDFDCSGGRGCNAAASPAGELAAGGNSVDSCFGDSGGPLYLETGIGDFLVGVTSRGFDDAELPCGEGGIYTRPDAVVDWLEAESGEAIPRATCNSPPIATADVTQLEVEEGESVTTVLTVEDPDASDTHRYQVTGAPHHGEATVSPDGLVEYTASDHYGGADEFTVQVTDSGVPSLSSQVMFEVSVHSDSGCACRTSAPRPGAAFLIALAALVPLTPRRRRRRS